MGDGSTVPGPTAEANRYSDEAGTLIRNARQGVDSTAPWPCQLIQFNRATPDFRDRHSLKLAGMSGLDGPYPASSKGAVCPDDNSKHNSMRLTNVNLDHVVLGAILAKPALLKEVYGFEDSDLDAAINAARLGKKEGLSQWLSRQGVRVSEEFLSVVILAHEKEVIEARIKRVSKKINAATSLKATARLTELTDELKGLLEKHEANTVKTKDASKKQDTTAKQVAPQKPVNTQGGNRTQKDTSEKNKTAESRQETKGAGVPNGSGQVSGTQSGVRVPGAAGPAKRPLQSTGPAPYRKDQVGSK